MHYSPAGPENCQNANAHGMPEGGAMLKVKIDWCLMCIRLSHFRPNTVFLRSNLNELTKASPLYERGKFNDLHVVLYVLLRTTQTHPTYVIQYRNRHRCTKKKINLVRKASSM